MITVKDLMESGNSSSPDGIHWEPALPEAFWFSWAYRFKDAFYVLIGRAIAIRQTEKADLKT